MLWRFWAYSCNSCSSPYAFWNLGLGSLRSKIYFLMHFTHLLGNYVPPGQSLLNRCDLDNISSLIIVSNDSLKTSYYWFFFSVPTSIFQTLADSFEYSLHNKLLLTILSIPFALVYLGEAHRSISRYGMNKLWLGMTMCWHTENIDADCSTKSSETCGSWYGLSEVDLNSIWPGNCSNWQGLVWQQLTSIVLGHNTI